VSRDGVEADHHVLCLNLGSWGLEFCLLPAHSHRAGPTTTSVKDWAHAGRGLPCAVGLAEVQAVASGP
jgi:hypothetical protein